MPAQRDHGEEDDRRAAARASRCRASQPTTGERTAAMIDAVMTGRDDREVSASSHDHADRAAPRRRPAATTSSPGRAARRRGEDAVSSPGASSTNWAAGSPSSWAAGRSRMTRRVRMIGSVERRGEEDITCFGDAPHGAQLQRPDRSVAASSDLSTNPRAPQALSRCGVASGGSAETSSTATDGCARVSAWATSRPDSAPRHRSSRMPSGASRDGDLERFAPAAGLADDRVAARRQQRPGDVPEHRLVVDDQDPGKHALAPAHAGRRPPVCDPAVGGS